MFENLERINVFLSHLDNPQKQLKSKGKNNQEQLTKPNHNSSLNFITCHFYYISVLQYSPHA